jgi:DNA-binding phage protein
MWAPFIKIEAMERFEPVEDLDCEVTFEEFLNAAIETGDDDYILRAHDLAEQARKRNAKNSAL